MAKWAFLFALLAGFTAVTYGAQPMPNPPAVGSAISIWPHGAPGPRAASGPEKETTSKGLVGGKPVTLLTNISNPTIRIYRPAPRSDTGAAVVVFPGGAYRILAIDIEGTEICRWLNSIGITAILLKYRVPEPKGLPPYAAPLQDAQRAVGYVRFQSTQWRLDPHRIGVIGFSAGGNLAAVLSTNFARRTYPAVDAADRVSCRPDFAMLIYPAYLVVKNSGYELAPELKPTAETPPSFLVQTEDDPIHVENSIFYFLAMKRPRVPAEMHIYPVGGHGYGLRPTRASVTGWPRLAERWLRSIGVLRTGTL
jgi:acetyl esterase/lipase